MSASATIWEPLERRSKAVFLVAGVLLLGYAVSKTVYTFTNVTPVGAFDVAYGGIGLLVAMLGLLGLYRRLRGGAPRVSIAGVAVTAIGVAGNLALLGWLAVATLTMGRYPAIPAEAPGWTVAVLVLVFLALALGFLLFGAAALRTDALPRTVSRLLVVPGLAWFGLILGNLLLPSGQYLGVLAYVPISLALLAIGYLLPAGAVVADRVESTPDSIA